MDMDIDFLDFSFYTVDSSYLQYLNSKDSEVYYHPNYNSTYKPFVGIMIGIGNYKYAIPLSSAKVKHRKWNNTSNSHFLIYEYVDENVNFPNDVYKDPVNGKKMHILAILDIKKMIPVIDGVCTKIEFSNLDQQYQDLFTKEYNFCLNIKEKILSKATKLYLKQKTENRVLFSYCDFTKLELASDNYFQKNMVE